MKTLARDASLAAAVVLLSTQAFQGSLRADDGAASKTTLVGFASLDADTLAEGPQSGSNNGQGQPISANGRSGPFAGQPVQGFSGVQFAPKHGWLAWPTAARPFWFLSDNGFGAKNNSADYLLRIHQVNPDFAWNKRFGQGSVALQGFVQLRDPDRKIPFAIVNEATSDRFLTGADFDVESFVLGANGEIWVGDEFGPFVLHFNAKGVLLEAPIATPDLAGKKLSSSSLVRAPENPFLGSGTANLGSSKGFEGMAFSPDRKTLYPLLEGGVTGDPPNALRIYRFDVASASFSGFVGFYPTQDAHPIGDFTPINDREFLVIERDNGQGAEAIFKRVFKVDLSQVDASGFVAKQELVDLMNIADPEDLNRDGNKKFTFPFVTIEDVLVLSDRTILVANDNNYPFSLGRGPDIDNDEIIVLRLDKRLRVDLRLFKE